MQRTLKCLSKQYAFICSVVLAYMPKASRHESAVNTILPEWIELVPPRFAIEWRNKWMIEQADYVVTYVTATVGSGAHRLKKLAERKNKNVINLARKKPESA